MNDRRPASHSPAAQAFRPAILMVLAALVLSFGSAAAQTPPPAPKGIIRGRVVGTDGRPIKQVIVRALGEGAVAEVAQSGRTMQRGAMTDSDGRFELKDLVADTYTIFTNRSGYFTIDPARRRTIPGKRVTLRDGEVLERVEIVVARTSAITGRVTDEEGEPVEGADIQPLQLRFVNGHRQLMEGGRSRRTNDLGQFRLYGLQPGEYVIAVVPATAGTNRLPGYSLSYYPGTRALAEAQLVAVDIGRDTQNVDVRLSPGRTARVSGLALGVDGRPLTSGLVMANSQRSGGLAGPPRTITAQADGSFEIAGVAPGEYVLQTRAFVGDSQAQFAMQFVTVGEEDVTGVTLRATAGSTVSGRITIEGGAAVKPSALTLFPFPSDFDLSPVAGNGYRATIAPDGTFEMKGLFGPLLFRLRSAPPGWMIKSVRSGARDFADMPLEFGRPSQSLDDVEIVVTNRSGSISGTVFDARGQAVVDYAVIVFATSRDRWYRESRFLTYAIAAPDGSFDVRGLPAAEYLVAAVDWMTPSPAFGEWQDPEVLEALARRASRVTLADGQRVQLALKLITR